MRHRCPFGKDKMNLCRICLGTIYDGESCFNYFNRVYGDKQEHSICRECVKIISDYAEKNKEETDG